jgi:regulatory protein
MARTITALRFQKRNPDRVNVFLDGAFAFGLAAVLAAQLKVGQLLTDDEIARLGGSDQVEKAFERALNFLSYRPRSVAEVRRNLRKKDLDDAVIEETIARLDRAGLVDDVEFARYWVDNRMQFNPRGGRALSYELLRRGVSPGIVAEAIEGLDEEGAARQVALSGARRYKGLPAPEFRRKLGAYMARRGFSYGVIKPLLEELSEATSNGSPSGEDLSGEGGRGARALSPPEGIEDGASSGPESEETEYE